MSTRPGRLSRSEAIAAATPPTRDRWADALRVGSLLVVILGHWLMVTVTAAGELSNALTAVPSAQPVTWLLQVMPLFFLVGGVAHAHTLESALARDGTATGRYAAFVGSRAARLLRPTVAFLATWLVLGAVAHLTGLTTGSQSRLVVNALVVVPQLLWFVGIYLGIAALAPPMWRWHRRIGLRAVGVLCVAAALVDVARFAGGLSLVGTLNYAFVWLALHQLGFCWRDGLLTTRRGWVLFATGATGLLLAVTVGPYPLSMVGLPGEQISNMAPPTLALLSQGIALAGLAVVARGPATRLLQRPRVWAGVVTAGVFAMTAFLWHLTALLLVLVASRLLGAPEPVVGTAGWWLTRPLWVALLSLPTVALVMLFVRFDRGQPDDRAPLRETRAWIDPAAGAAVLLAVVGILMVAMVGVDVLGNRPVFFLVGDVTPGAAMVLFVLGCAGMLVVRPRRQA